MRILVRVLVVLLLLVAVAIGALLVAMPRIVESDAVRARIEAAAHDALGRELRYENLDFGLFPPSLLVEQASVSGATAGDPPLAEVRTIALRVALMPLLSREVVVDSFLVEGAVVRLRRTADGIELPAPVQAPSPTEADAPSSAPSVEPAEGDGAASVDLAVRGFSVRGARVILEDETLSPPGRIDVQQLDVNARIVSLDEPIEFDFAAALSEGGAISAGGTATLAGALDVKVTLDAVDLAVARAYLGDGLEVSGKLSGQVTARGDAASPETLRAELSLADGRITMDEIALSGPLSMMVDLSGELSSPNGRFEVDATDASLRYGGAFDKQPGKPARVTGRIVSGADGKPGVDDVELHIGNAKARGAMSVGQRTRLVAQVEPFDLKGWDEMVPALAEYRLQGPVRMDEFTVLTGPLDVRGAIHLDSVRGQVPDRGPVLVEGSIVAHGSRIETQGLKLTGANQVIALEARIAGLDGDIDYHFEAETHETDTNQLVSAFTSRRDTFFGVLDFDAKISGNLGDGPPLEFARGQTRVEIRDGKVVGLSLIQALFAGIGDEGDTAAGLAGIALDVASVYTQQDLSRFYGEEFESLTGTFRLGGGVASTDDLRLVYRDYTADLTGRIDLVNSKFDLQAVLTMGPEVDQALGGDRAAKAAEDGPLIIPVPVRGRLDQAFRLGQNPTLDITPELVTIVASRYLGEEIEEMNQFKQQGKDEIDEALGEGAGDLAEDLIRSVPGLGGLFGGPSPARQPKPAREPDSQSDR